MQSIFYPVIVWVAHTALFIGLAAAPPKRATFIAYVVVFGILGLPQPFLMIFARGIVTDDQYGNAFFATVLGYLPAISTAVMAATRTAGSDSELKAPDGSDAQKNYRNANIGTMCFYAIMTLIAVGIVSNS